MVEPEQLWRPHVQERMLCCWNVTQFWAEPPQPPLSMSGARSPAAMAAEEKIRVDQVDVKELQARLTQQDVAITASE